MEKHNKSKRVPIAVYAALLLLTVIVMTASRLGLIYVQARLGPPPLPTQENETTPAIQSFTLSKPVDETTFADLSVPDFTQTVYRIDLETAFQRLTMPAGVSKEGRLTVIHYADSFSDDAENMSQQSGLTAMQKTALINSLESIWQSRRVNSKTLASRQLVLGEAANLQHGWWSQQGFSSDRFAISYLELSLGQMRGALFIEQSGQDLGLSPQLKAALIDPQARRIIVASIPLPVLIEYEQYLTPAAGTDFTTNQLEAYAALELTGPALHIIEQRLESVIERAASNF